MSSQGKNGSGGKPEELPDPGKPGTNPGEAISGNPEDWIYEETEEDLNPPPTRPALTTQKLGRVLVKKAEPAAKPSLTKVDPASAEWRLLILDTWGRSGLPATDFLALIGNVVEKHTLYTWKKRFEAEGPGGLVDRPRAERRRSDRLADATVRAILMMKEAHPEWGINRISDSLLRGPGLAASTATVLRVLHEAGYEAGEERREPHGVEPKRFERALPQEMWQSDIFTFILKRQNRRVHMVGFMDDHSRFIVSFGLHVTASSAFVIEAFRAGITNYGPPKEVLTDNGSQYKTWRGTSAFAKELKLRGVAHIVAAPRHPKTLGKIERFWGTLWDECVGAAIFHDLEDARKRIGHFIDHYNFQRPHQGVGGLVPADRFFGAAPEVLKTLNARVAANALDLAMHGLPKAPFYVTGQVAGRAFSVHAEGERMIMTKDGAERQEVELVGPKAPPPEMPEPVCPQGAGPGSIADAGNEEPPAPGASPLDEGLKRLEEGPKGGRS